MAFVPDYKNDIFVSYARVDDLPPLNAKGWVTTLVEELKKLLAQKLGRLEAYSLWMDHELRGNEQITQSIMDILSNTATFVVILSHGYLASMWCQKEKGVFLNMVKKHVREGSSIFVIERECLDVEERPPEFGDVKGYCFWVPGQEGERPRTLGVPTPQVDEPRYHNLLNELSCDLAEELKKLQRVKEARAGCINKETSLAPDDRPTVFLADVTDDLYSVREDVEHSLIEADLQVLPEAYYSYEPIAFQKTVRDNLAKSDLFVQLLSALPGKRPPGLLQGYVRCQYELALETGTPILQWRSPDLDVDSVQDPEQRNFLQLETVQDVTIEEFKLEIVRRIPQKTTVPLDLLVFLDADTHDSALANDISQVLYEKCKAGYLLPLQSKEPSENREAFEQYVRHCDALIIVYGYVGIKWVSDQCMAVRKISWQREQPLLAFAIYDGPPEQKPPVTLKLPGMQILRCRTCLDDKKLYDFCQKSLIRKEETL